MTRGLTILALLLLVTSPITVAQPEPPTQAVEYYAVETKVLDDGTSLDIVLINGPPTPPPGFEIERAAVPEHVAASATLPVPAYDWSYGCSATSAAMIAAYYDRTSYPNMYTGSTNGGVMPMDNSTWGHTTWPRCDEPGTISVGECPLSATHNGIDGRSTDGHVDDYWIGYDCSGPDPYETDPPEHTIGDCTGDYMETNKWFSAYGFNGDGGTLFVFDTTGAEAYATDLEASGPPWSYDGGVGVKQFYESRGYVVTSAYNQYIKGQGSNPSLGFTYDQYKAEIDAGRPVIIQVEGHTMVGVGYDDSASDQMYIHDTWDYSTHTMIWGSTYLGMQHKGVTIVQLQQHLDLSIVKRAANGGLGYEPGDPVTFTLSIENRGAISAMNVIVTDTLSSDILTPTFDSSLSITERGVVSYSWDLPDLMGGASGVITIYGAISPTMPITGMAIWNTAIVSSDGNDSNTANNSSTALIGGERVYLPLVMRNY